MCQGLVFKKVTSGSWCHLENSYSELSHAQVHILESSLSVIFCRGLPRTSWLSQSGILFRFLKFFPCFEIRISILLEMLMSVFLKFIGETTQVYISFADLKWITSHLLGSILLIFFWDKFACLTGSRFYPSWNNVLFFFTWGNSLIFDLNKICLNYSLGSSKYSKLTVNWHQQYLVGIWIWTQSTN